MKRLYCADAAATDGNGEDSVEPRIQPPSCILSPPLFFLSLDFLSLTHTYSFTLSLFSSFVYPSLRSTIEYFPNVVPFSPPGPQTPLPALLVVSRSFSRAFAFALLSFFPCRSFRSGSSTYSLSTRFLNLELSLFRVVPVWFNFFFFISFFFYTLLVITFSGCGKKPTIGDWTQP